MSPVSAADLVLATAIATLYALTSVVAFAAAASLHAERRATLLLGWAMAQHTIDAVLGGSPIAAALGAPGPWSTWIVTLVNYFVAVPWAMLVEELIGPGWKASVRRTWQGYLLFAVVAVIIDLARGEPGTAEPVSGIVIGAGALVGLLNLLHARHTMQMRVLRAGILIFLALVVQDALARAGWLPWRSGTGPLGVLVCVGAIAFTVVARTIRARTALLGLEHELATARRIQLSLLPERAPTLDGAAIGFRYVPAAAVAGDLFEFLAPTPRSTGVLVADVSGHGVPAALIASMVKVAAAAQRPHAHDPARVLAGIHLALAGELPRGHFVTAVYVHLDLDRGVLRHASAGHPPALVCRAADGSVEAAGTPGPLLIDFAPAEYPVSEVSLASGDRVVLYTDGVVEAMRADDEMFGVERLAALAATARNGPDTLVQDVLDSVSAFAERGGAAFDDDCTVVALEIGRYPAPAAIPPSRS